MAAEVNPYATESVRLGRFVFPVPTLLAFGIALLVILGAHLVLRRTFIGRALRAYAEDRPIAAAFGIDHRRIGVLLAAVTGATAAVAGMLFSLANALIPSTAFEWFGTVFAVVILGGIGHLVGTLAAGVLVGLLSSVVSVVLSPATAPFVLFSAIILALILRPQGLFTTAGAHR
jgi:branched-chain amino acid transport system permease protein